MKYKDKIVWITGASAGIGEALALEFAREGAKLILSARRVDELERVRKATGLPEDSVFVLPLDLAQHELIPNIVRTAITKFGRIDVLINNGGVSSRSSVEETELETYKRSMDINFFGAVVVTKAVLPTMQKQKSGHIVAMSSVAGKIGTKRRSAYSAAKHALHGFFDSLRAEMYSHNICVTIACPGYIRTDISRNALTGDGKKFNKMDKNQENGMPAQKLATILVKAIYKRKSEVYIGGKETLGVYIKRFFPKMIERIVRKVEAK